MSMEGTARGRRPDIPCRLAAHRSNTASPSPPPSLPRRCGAESYNNLIRPKQQRGRNGKAKRDSRLAVDNKLELRWLLYRQIGGIRPSQNLAYVASNAAKPTRVAFPVAHQRPKLDGTPHSIDIRQAMSRRQFDRSRVVRDSDRRRPKPYSVRPTRLDCVERLRQILAVIDFRNKHRQT